MASPLNFEGFELKNGNNGRVRYKGGGGSADAWSKQVSVGDASRRNELRRGGTVSLNSLLRQANLGVGGAGKGQSRRKASFDPAAASAGRAKAGDEPSASVA